MRRKQRKKLLNLRQAQSSTNLQNRPHAKTWDVHYFGGEGCDRQSSATGYRMVGPPSGNFAGDFPVINHSSTAPNSRSFLLPVSPERTPHVALPAFGTALLLIAVLICTSCKYDSANLIAVPKKPRFLVGVNIAWNSFGADVGKHPSLGVLHDIRFFDSVFAEISNAGGNSVRWWVHCDGRSSPNFDSTGMVTGFDPEIFEHLDAIMNSAFSNNLLVMPVLWSFDMANDNSKEAGPNAGMHANLIWDSLCTKSYIENCLVPLVKRYEDNPALLAWEICNEPEWMLDTKNITRQKVSAKQLQKWVGMLTVAIRKESPRAQITVGSASFKWNWDNPAGKERNLWSDSALYAATGDSLSCLSFYEVHYYPGPKGQKELYSPFACNAKHWALNKPILIGEFPGKGEPGHRTVAEMYRSALDSSYAGAMAWSYIGRDPMGSWADIRPGVERVSSYAKKNKILAKLGLHTKMF